ncbi:putative transmembrane protein, partial [Toxoplasma gondii RUB]
SVEEAPPFLTASATRMPTKSSEWCFARRSSAALISTRSLLALCLSFFSEEGMSQKAIIVFIVAISAMVICIGVVLVMWWMSSEREKKRRHVARDAERAPGLFFSEDEGPMSTDDKSAPKKPAGGNSPNTRDAGESISRERQIIEEDLGKVLVVDPVSGVMRSRQKWQRNGNWVPDKRMLAGAERTCRTGQQKFKK